jgi:hypothetical protein
LSFAVLKDDSICTLNEFVMPFYLQFPNSTLLLPVNNSYFNIVVSNSNNSLIIFNLENSLQCGILNVFSPKNVISLNSSSMLPSSGTISDINFISNNGAVEYISDENIINYYPNNYPLVFSGLNTINYQFLYSNNNPLRPLKYFVAGIYLIFVSPFATNVSFDMKKNGVLIIDLNQLIVGSNYNVSYTNPQNGSLYYDNLNNRFLYIPNKGFTGNDSFQYTVTAISAVSGLSLISPSSEGNIIISIF